MLIGEYANTRKIYTCISPLLFTPHVTESILDLCCKHR